ncbi:MAG: hypothetical protein WC001_05355 [Desulfurivibrionaceae bacterium]
MTYKNKGKLIGYKSGPTNALVNSLSVENVNILNESVNLDNLDVHNLVSELVSKYNQNNDVGVIQSWFRRNRLEGQEKHLQALLRLVRQVREHSSDLLEFKARLISQREVLGNLIIQQVEESQFNVDRQREGHQTFIVQQEMERQRAHGEHVRIKLENDKVRLESERIIAENRLVELRGTLIEKITTELDMKNISPPQAFVLIKALNPNSKDSDVYMAQEALDKMKAEADIKRAEARKAGFEADHEEYKMKESQKTP